MDRLFRLVFGRHASKAEKTETIKFLDSHRQFVSVTNNVDAARPPLGVDTRTFRVWADLCLAVLNMNEFLYVR